MAPSRPRIPISRPGRSKSTWSRPSPRHRFEETTARRSGHRRRQVVRLPRAGHRRRREEQAQDRHLHTHDRASGTTRPQGHSVPAVRVAGPRVHAGARERPRQLHQPCTAPQRPAAAHSLLDSFPAVQQLNEMGKWSRRTADGSRSDLPMQPYDNVWDLVQSDSGNCLGRKSKITRGASTSRPGARCSANLLIVNHALLLHGSGMRRLGASLLPEFTTP